MVSEKFNNAEFYDVKLVLILVLVEDGLGVYLQR